MEKKTHEYTCSSRPNSYILKINCVSLIDLDDDSGYIPNGGAPSMPPPGNLVYALSIFNEIFTAPLVLLQKFDLNFIILYYIMNTPASIISLEVKSTIPILLTMC